MTKRAVLVTWMSLLALLVGGCKRSSEPARREQRVETPAPAPTAAAPAPAPADPWSKPAPAKDPLPRPLFWTAEKDGKTTYLLGTMHVGVDAESRLPQLVWDRLDAASAFAMEADISNAGELLESMKRTSGRLRDELGPEYWTKLENALGPAIARTVDAQKPMVAASLLSMRGLPSTPPMDGVLLGRATNRSKPIVYLETPETQIALLDKHMDAKQVKQMLDNEQSGLDDAKQMLAAYESGDEAQIESIATKQREESLAHGSSAAEYEQQMQDLLYGRNASWIPAIEQMHATGNGFVAVGAMHLIGKRSVLELLAQKGYKIARVTP
ncbi:MAG: TraB/GumN family protein [Kofleriaceae bacterium]